jgi:hypothetical protein
MVHSWFGFDSSFMGQVHELKAPSKCILFMYPPRNKWKLNEENQKFDKGAQLWNHKTNNNQICT